MTKGTHSSGITSHGSIPTSSQTPGCMPVQAGRMRCWSVVPRSAGNLCPAFTKRPFPTCIHSLPRTGPWCRDLGVCPGPPALGQRQACLQGRPSPWGLPHGSGKLPCPAPGSAAEPPWVLVLRSLLFLPWSPTLGGLACLRMAGGPQLPWLCTWAPPPHPAGHPWAQHRTRSLASPS